MAKLKFYPNNFEIENTINYVLITLNSLKSLDLLSVNKIADWGLVRDLIRHYYKFNALTERQFKILQNAQEALRDWQRPNSPWDDFWEEAIRSGQ